MKIKNILKYIGIVLLVAFVLIQFIRPEKNNGGIDNLQAFFEDTQPTREVAAILKTNCYDCHTDQTVYPWYNEIAPISLWLADHVNDAKGHFNMAAWSSYSTKKKDHKLEELIEEVKEGEMPLPSYTWLHGTLSEADKQALLQWATIARLKYTNDLNSSSQ